MLKNRSDSRNTKSDPGIRRWTVSVKKPAQLAGQHRVPLAQRSRSASAIPPPPGCVLMERSPQDKPAHLCYAAPPRFTTATAKESVGFKVPLVLCDHGVALLRNTSSQLFQLPFSLEKAFIKSCPCETGVTSPCFTVSQAVLVPSLAYCSALALVRRTTFTPSPSVLPLTLLQPV